MAAFGSSRNTFGSQRSFQHSNFGSDRGGDSVAPWKQRMMNRLLTSSRQHRSKLMDKLKSNQNKKESGSPNSKKTFVNQTIDSFKMAIIENDKNDPSRSQMSAKDYQDLDKALEDEYFKDLRKECEQMILEQEEMFIKDQETSTMSELDLEMSINPLSKTKKSNNNKSNNNNTNNNNNSSNNSKCSNTQNDNDYFNDAIVCPICNNDIIGVEDFDAQMESKDCSDQIVSQINNMNLNQNDNSNNSNHNNNNNKSEKYKGMKIYRCVGCQSRWQASEESLRYPIKVMDNNNNNNNRERLETSNEHCQRLFVSLQNTLASVFSFHRQNNNCSAKPNFGVENQTKYLQVWCHHCKFNTLL